MQRRHTTLRKRAAARPSGVLPYMFNEKGTSLTLGGGALPGPRPSMATSRWSGKCWRSPRPSTSTAWTTWGRTRLQLAVGNEHLEVTELLLKREPGAGGDALLLAISKGYVRTVEAILSHPALRQEGRLALSPLDRSCATHPLLRYDEDARAHDITPIILAAHCQEYEIVSSCSRAPASSGPTTTSASATSAPRSSGRTPSATRARMNAYKGLASVMHCPCPAKTQSSRLWARSNEPARLANIGDWIQRVPPLPTLPAGWLQGSSGCVQEPRGLSSDLTNSGSLPFRLLGRKGSSPVADTGLMEKQPH